jgi:hypothetical protein
MILRPLRMNINQATALPGAQATVVVTAEDGIARIRIR